MQALLPDAEPARLQALREYQILDTAQEAEFDDFTVLAAHICGVPIALISLIDSDRQWFKSKVGLELTESAREHSFCAHALGQSGIFTVPDARADTRFADNPLVREGPEICFYAGAPLVTEDGHVLGTLCVIDRKPRILTPEQEAALAALSRQVIARLELRRQLAEREQAERALRVSEARKSAILQSALDCIITIDQEGRVLEWNPAAERTFGLPAGGAVGQELAELIVPPSLRYAHRQGMARYLETGEGPALHTRIEITALRADGTEFPVELAITPILLPDQTLFTATLRDISRRKQAERLLHDREEQYRLLFENATHGIYRTTPDGRILLANPALVQMLGFDSFEQLATRNLETGGIEAAYARNEFKSRLEAEGELRGLEAAWERRDGRTIFVRENARLVRDPDGTPAFYEGSVEDITAYKEAEEALRQAHIELEMRVERRTAALAGANQALAAEIAERRHVQRQLTQALQERENIMETVPDILFRLDLSGHLVQWNRKMEVVTGLSPSELRGIAALDLFPVSERAGIAEAITQAFQTGYAEVEGALLGSGGVLVPHQFQGVPLRDAGEKVIGLTGTGRDITESRRQQAALAESEQRYRSLVEHSPEGIVVYSDNRLVYLNKAALELFGAETQEQLLGQLVLDVVHPKWRDTARERARLSQKLGQASSLAEFKYLRMDGSAVEVEAVSTPILFEGKPAGQVLIRDITGRKRAEEEIYRLHAELTQAYERTLNAYDATIEGWSRALDYRDHETEGHSRRVTQLTLRLARAVGMDEEALIHVRRGALLHDIGKMGVPDGILRKPGPLDDNEWDIMRRHPSLAHEMLGPITFLRPALDIPLCHHEKWDGTGYPRGLRGEEIPTAARIFAIVDVWDALCSDRPYRKAWARDRVVEHVRALSGSHFDPQVVGAFLALIAGDEHPLELDLAA